MIPDNPLSYILIRENVISPKGLKEIREHIERSPAEDLSVFDAQKTNETGETSWQVDKNTRDTQIVDCLLYTSPSPRDVEESRMPSSA